MVRRFATSLTVLGAVFALLALATVPAFAHHREDHAQADAHEADSSKSGDEDGDDDNMHPSGNDRETNDGPDDDVQGRSSSEPDDNDSGPERDHKGTDKTGGPGGVDTEDQDGNNGCGNDDDFEDDNEGNCGKPESSTQGRDEIDEQDDEDVAVEGETIHDEVAGDDVLGLRFRGSPRVGRETVAAVPAVRADRARGSVLPFTGNDAWGFVFMALGLVAAGYLMLRMKRT